ncbi:MAG: sulfotransferase domain-containing protein [Flavobacteriales bacterium]
MALIKDVLYRFKLRLPIGLKDRLKRSIPDFLLSSLREKEVWVLSYPKCGRSWLKLMLCDMVYSEHPEKERIDDVSTNLLWKIDNRIPRICFAHDGNPMYRTPEGLEKDKSPYAHTHVIFLVRDPRDVLVSWYYEFKYRGHQEAFNENWRVNSLSEMVHSERGGIATIIAYYNSWIEASDVPRSFYLLKYEDLAEAPFPTLKGLLQQLGIDAYISDASVQKAIERNAFEAVQERESQGAIRNSAVHGVKEFKGHGEEEPALKARKGKIGSYLEELSEADIDYVDRMLEEELDPRFGYGKS